MCRGNDQQSSRVIDRWIIDGKRGVPGKVLHNFRTAKQPNEMALTICNLISHNCFWLMRDWKLESLANGKEISAVPFLIEKEEYL